MRTVWRLFYPVVVYDMLTAMIFLLRPDAEPLAAQGVSAAIAAAILLPAYLVPRNGTDGSLRRKRIRGNGRLTCTGFLALAGISVSLCLNCLILAGRAAGRIPDYTEATRLIYNPPLWRQVLCAGFLIPVTEELVFRGTGYEALRERWPWPAAAAITGALFGLYHTNPVQGIYAFLVSFLLVWCRERCGGLWAAVTVHIAANLAAIAGEAAGLGRCRDMGVLFAVAAVSGGGLCAAMYGIWRRAGSGRQEREEIS